MVFLVQFKIGPIRCDRYDTIMLQLNQRNIQLRALIEKRRKKCICARFIPSCPGELQTINAISVTRQLLSELGVKYKETLVLIVERGICIRDRLAKRVKIIHDYYCPHVLPNHPGFQVFEVSDPIVADQIASEVV